MKTKLQSEKKNQNKLPPKDCYQNQDKDGYKAVNIRPKIVTGVHARLLITQQPPPIYYNSNPPRYFSVHLHLVNLVIGHSNYKSLFNFELEYEDGTSISRTKQRILRVLDVTYSKPNDFIVKFHIMEISKKHLKQKFVILINFSDEIRNDSALLLRLQSVKTIPFYVMVRKRKEKSSKDKQESNGSAVDLQENSKAMIWIQSARQLLKALEHSEIIPSESFTRQPDLEKEIFVQCPVCLAYQPKRLLPMNHVIGCKLHSLLYESSKNFVVYSKMLMERYQLFAMRLDLREEINVVSDLRGKHQSIYALSHNSDLINSEKSDLLVEEESTNIAPIEKVSLNTGDCTRSRLALRWDMPPEYNAPLYPGAVSVQKESSTYSDSSCLSFPSSATLTGFSMLYSNWGSISRVSTDKQ